MNIACILLAAGLSSRFQGEKLLAESEGVPIGVRAIRLHGAVPYSERILVTRPQHTPLLNAAKDCGFTAVFNDDPTRGISSSIRIGLDALTGKPDGILFGVSDQPGLSGDTVLKLISAFSAHPDRIAAPFHSGERGNPVIFPASLRDELAALTGDVGGGRVIKRHPELLLPVEIASESDFFDIDTRADLASRPERN